jgi:molybdopterin molybdotransferase
MLSVAEAQDIVLSCATLLDPETIRLDAKALGLVLAEDLQSDLDIPPYDKSLMDGYAVRSVDLPSGEVVLDVIEEVLAGATPRREVGPGQATRVMTGAPIPKGADAVVLVERTVALDSSRVHVKDRPPRPEQNLLRRGRELRAGELALSRGTTLKPQELGLLASIGHSRARVYPRPEAAILGTGDELVEAEQTPGPGQIRNSNGPMLAGQVARAGAIPRCLGIARDNRDSLTALIKGGLEGHLLMLSGGVSAGKADLVPDILGELGVQPRFHKVALKPGKPIYFGTYKEKLVFGLPGNPVSTLVCFELFVRPAICRLMGRADPHPPFVQARLAENFSQRGDRPTYHPARLMIDAEGFLVQPLPWIGSSDLRGLLGSNAFVLFEPGERLYQRGERLPVLTVDEFGATRA